MLFRDRPLLPTGLDSDLYVDRPRLEHEILVTVSAGRNVLLLGDAGAGKSTLLRKVAGEIEAEGRATVLVSGGLADDAGDLLELVDAALEERVPRVSPLSPHSGGPEAARLLRAARRLARPDSAVIIVDDVATESGFDLFGRLRDELWSLGHTWLVGVRPRDSAALRTPPADAFWGRVFEIPPLNSAETEELLRHGLSDEEYRRLDADRLLSGAHPRLVIRWAQSRLEGDDGANAERPGPPWYLEQAAQLGRAEALAIAELQSIDRPVSAHDSELLERLGWSRPYAQRILSNLEEHELLRSIPERRDAPGRPRKLYELNPNPTHQ